MQPKSKRQGNTHTEHQTRRQTCRQRERVKGISGDHFSMAIAISGDSSLSYLRMYLRSVSVALSRRPCTLVSGFPENVSRRKCVVLFPPRARVRENIFSRCVRQLRNPRRARVGKSLCSRRSRPWGGVVKQKSHTRTHAGTARRLPTTARVATLGTLPSTLTTVDARRYSGVVAVQPGVDDVVDAARVASEPVRSAGRGAAAAAALAAPERAAGFTAAVEPWEAVEARAAAGVVVVAGCRWLVVLLVVSARKLVLNRERTGGRREEGAQNLNHVRRFRQMLRRVATKCQASDAVRPSAYVTSNGSKAVGEVVLLAR